MKSINLLTELGFDNRVVRLWLQFQTARSGCQLRCGPYAWDLTKDNRVIRINREQFASVMKLARDFDELFEALIPVQAGHTLLLDFSRLHVHTYRGAGLQFELAQWPEPDAPIDAYLNAYQPTGKELAFDVGAEAGVSTYLLSQVCGTVISFEQKSHLRTVLQRNIVRHALANVKVAKETVGSLAEMVRLYGEPKFCRIDLDKVTNHFLLAEAHTWTNLSTVFAARSTSKPVCKRFAGFLKDTGMTISVDPGVGLIWAGQGLMWEESE